MLHFSSTKVSLGFLLNVIHPVLYRGVPRGSSPPRPSRCEAAWQGSPDLQNKPRSRPRRQRWLLQPGTPRVTDSAESKSKASFGS